MAESFRHLLYCRKKIMKNSGFCLFEKLGRKEGVIGVFFKEKPAYVIRRAKKTFL